MTTIEVRTRGKVEAVDITRQVQAAVAAAGRQEGAVLVYCPHTTAGVFVNEGADPDVARDVNATLALLVPREGDYAHAEGNSAAHIRSILVGASATVPLAAGRMALGTWQHVFLAEFDGPRDRSVFVQVLG